MASGKNFDLDVQKHESLSRRHKKKPSNSK